jgi:hypothetical protein
MLPGPAARTWSPAARPSEPRGLADDGLAQGGGKPPAHGVALTELPLLLGGVPVVSGRTASAASGVSGAGVPRRDGPAPSAPRGLAGAGVPRRGGAARSAASGLAGAGVPGCDGAVLSVPG